MNGFSTAPSGTITAGSIGTTELADGAVTNAKLADMAARTIKMRVTGSTGVPEDGTVTQLTGLLAANALLGLPIVVAVKNVAVLTSGAPADIATITLPAGLTRWGTFAGTGTHFNRVIAETAAGTLAGAALSIFDTAGGAGSVVSSTVTALPAVAGLAVGFTGVNPATTPFYTSQTIHIRQTANSANAGTISIYIWIMPLL